MMDRYLSGQDLTAQLRLTPFQLHELVEGGLAPHDYRTGLVIKTISADLSWLRDHMKRINELTSQLNPLPQPALPGFSGGRSGSTPPSSENIKKELATLQAQIEDIRAKGVELPQLTDQEWSTCIVLDRSTATFSRLNQAHYKQSQVLAKVGHLPNSCPNQIECFREFQTLPTTQTATNNKAKQQTPGYLDMRHESHSHELRIAIECWQALFTDGGIRGGRGVKDQAIKWIKQNHPVLSNEAMTRIATVINPSRNKRGGTPKLPE